MKKSVSIILACVILLGMVSCATGNGGDTTGTLAQTSEPQGETTTGAETDGSTTVGDTTTGDTTTGDTTAGDTTTGDTTTGDTTAGDTTTGDTTTPTPPVITDPIGVNMSDLSDIMKPIFMGNTVKNETVMFLDKGDTKILLYPIDEIISVTSYDGTKVYKEGVDYSLVNGKLKVLENSSIPCITKARYYNAGTNYITKYNGQSVKTYWGEFVMDDWQICVNYTHKNEWNEFKQESYDEVYERLIKKLQNGDDVTLIFSGDSISTGSNASYNENVYPYQHTYTMLFAEALADLFDYTVKYIDTQAELGRPNRVPTTDYVAGTRGTITYINTAVGGWNSEHPVNNCDSYILDYVNRYGCDLLVLAFGMNDGFEPMGTRNNLKTVTDRVLKISPNTSVTFISTMVCNPEDSGRSAASKANQRGEIYNLAEYYRKSGFACGVSDMGSVSLAILTRKDYRDFSGNNINHCNDFFNRVYAQTLLQAVIGYENMN